GVQRQRPAHRRAARPGGAGSAGVRDARSWPRSGSVRHVRSRADRHRSRLAARRRLERLMGGTLFELSLLGGAIERRYRRLRPDVDALPWKTLVERARRFWTMSAFTEHRAAAAAAATVAALIAARAPLDLIAVASQFVIEELAHVEISARIAGALGGGVPLIHDPHALGTRPDPALAPLTQAAELVVRVYCVAESYSLAMLSPGRDGGHPLLRAALARIKK